MSIFAPTGGGTGTATARLLDATSGQQVASAPLGSGDTTVDLAAVPAAAHQSLKVVFDLQSSDGQATPRVKAFKVLYDSILAPTMTFAAAPTTIVFGKGVALTGTVLQGGVPVAGQPVTLSAQPVGTTVFTPLPPVTTDAAGNFRVVVKPAKRTTYKATYTGVSPEPTLVVAVKHAITLKASRKAGKLYLRGTIGPKHVRRTVLVQKLKGRRWVTIAKVKTSRKSAFKLVRKAAAKRAKFRARIKADSEHLANTSRVVRG
jgi:hypothetical protein